MKNLLVLVCNQTSFPPTVTCFLYILVEFINFFLPFSFTQKHTVCSLRYIFFFSFHLSYLGDLFISLHGKFLIVLNVLWIDHRLTCDWEFLLG